MMENGTVTPFLVKRSVKGEKGAGGDVTNNGASPSGKTRPNGGDGL